VAELVLSPMAEGKQRGVMLIWDAVFPQRIVEARLGPTSALALVDEIEAVIRKAGVEFEVGPKLALFPRPCTKNRRQGENRPRLSKHVLSLDSVGERPQFLTSLLVRSNCHSYATEAMFGR